MPILKNEAASVDGLVKWSLHTTKKPFFYCLWLFIAVSSRPDNSVYKWFKKKKGRLNRPIENVIDLFPDVRSQPQELSIDPVQGGFEEVSLSGILTVEKF